MKANRLRCEQMKNPMGIDVVRPRLSWICESGVRQSAYEIEVKSADEMIYHSGKVVSDAMSMILEKELESKQRLSWRVRLWDENDNEGEWSEEATFEMGILQQEQFVAKWINPLSSSSEEDPVLSSSALTADLPTVINTYTL